MKIYIFASLLVITMCAGCFSAAENRIYYEDRVAREMLADALKMKKISYRTDADGGVWYSTNEESAVAEIAKKILADRFSEHAVSFEDIGDVKLFRDALRLSGISYKTKLQHGKEWTTWEKSDDVRVKEIQERIEDENMARAKITKQSPQKIKQ